MNLYTLVMSLCLSAVTLAADPAPAPRPTHSTLPPEATGAAKLSGPVEAPYMIELKVTGVSKGSAVLWDLYYKDSRTGMFYAEGAAQTRIIKSEQAFIFAGPAGGYRVKCRLVKGEDTTELAWEGKLTAGGVPTPPVPPVPPVPPAPDGKLGLIKVSRDGYGATADPNKAATAKLIASNTRSLASVVAAGGLPDPTLNAASGKKVLDEWAKSVQAAITSGKSNVTAWESWGNPVGQAFYAAYTAGKLKTKADWVDALNEIADGLSP